MTDTTRAGHGWKIPTPSMRNIDWISRGEDGDPRIRYPKFGNHMTIREVLYADKSQGRLEHSFEKAQHGWQSKKLTEFSHEKASPRHCTDHTPVDAQMQPWNSPAKIVKRSAMRRRKRTWIM